MAVADVPEPRSGVVASLDVVALRAIAEELDATIELVPRIGGYVERDRALFRVLPARHIETGDLQEKVALADERTIDQDPLFAIRLMVDIAIRALSPAINDPTTAVQALDRIGDFLIHVVGRRLDARWTAGAEGRDRLFIRMPTWDDVLELSFSEVRYFGGSSMQVVRKLRSVLEGLLDAAHSQRRPSVENELRLLDRCVEQNFPNVIDRQIVSVADAQGLGGR